MAELTLDIARKILDAALAKAVEKKIKPLVITVLDARGAVKVTAAQDGTSLMRAEIAHGKAYGALALGMGSRALFQRAQEQAYFVSAINTMAKGQLVPVPVFAAPTESRAHASKGVYPLEFLPRKADNYMNSTFANIPLHQRMEARTAGVLEMHATDAAARNLNISVAESLAATSVFAEFGPSGINQLSGFITTFIFKL